MEQAAVQSMAPEGGVRSYLKQILLHPSYDSRAGEYLRNLVRGYYQSYGESSLHDLVPILESGLPFEMRNPPEQQGTPDPGSLGGALGPPPGMVPQGTPPGLPPGMGPEQMLAQSQGLMPPQMPGAMPPMPGMGGPGPMPPGGMGPDVAAQLLAGMARGGA